MSRIALGDYDEDAPFLDLNEAPDEPLPEDTSSAPPSMLRRAKRWQVHKPRDVIILLCVSKFFMVTSGLMMMMPMYRLIEDAFCHVHYKDDSDDLIEEMKCKVDEVQSALAFLMGWFGVVGSVMNLIVSYPYGMLADKIGRKPTLLLAYGGMACSFSLSPLMLGPGKYAMRSHPYMMLVGSLFILIGGGVPVLMATTYAIAADVSTEENKSSNFLYLTLGATSGGLIGPLISGLLMERWGPWVPIATVLCLVPLNFVIFSIIPETLSIDVKTKSTDNDPPLVAMKKHIAHGIEDLLNSLRMLLNPNIALCLVVFFFHNARATAGTATNTQYISKNFGWTLAEISILLSPLGLLNIFVLAALPKANEILVSPRFGFSTFGKDILLARISLLILAMSAVMRAMAPNFGVYIFALSISCLGTAESALVRATVTHFVEPSYTSRLYALAGMAEILGAFVGAPVLAWFFDMGMRLKGAWTGLPWMYLAVVCFVCWATLLFVRAPKKGWDDNDVFGGAGDEGDQRPSNPIHLD